MQDCIHTVRSTYFQYKFCIQQLRIYIHYYVYIYILLRGRYVGDRLAAAAWSVAYGHAEKPATGPVLAGCRLQGSRLILSYNASLLKDDTVTPLISVGISPRDQDQHTVSDSLSPSLPLPLSPSLSLPPSLPLSLSPSLPSRWFSRGTIKRIRHRQCRSCLGHRSRVLMPRATLTLARKHTTTRLGSTQISR